MRRKSWILVAAAFIVCAVSFTAVSAAPDKSKKEAADTKDNLYTQVELFSDAVSIIRSDYVSPMDSKKLIYGALRGMLASLDDFSSFMDPEEYKEIKSETKGEFGGLGIEISTRDGIITVIAPMASTPAEAAGIKAGDKIVKIDNKVTRDMTLSEAVRMMRGEPGTQVTLTIWREKGEKILDFVIKRDIIKVSSIKNASFLEGKIGYIKIAEFQENTPSELDAALKKLESGGMDSLVIDLRNNPGGLLEVSVDVAERFLPKDSVIVSIKSRTPAQNAVFRSSGKHYSSNYPLAVLVNEGSASASEIVSGAIQDNRRGIIIGTKTFGKASVQTVIPLKDGSALRLTTALYYTPSGKMIRNEGIIPDVVVENGNGKKKPDNKDIFEDLDKKKAEPQAKAKEGTDRDIQVDTAINMIKTIKFSRMAEKKT
ncbi:MAG: S41 family peptidase [Candidatus Omnitrophota bacterium]|jgi:carboxyl-terminal processing protease